VVPLGASLSKRSRSIDRFPYRAARLRPVGPFDDRERCEQSLEASAVVDAVIRRKDAAVADGKGQEHLASGAEEVDELLHRPEVTVVGRRRSVPTTDADVLDRR